MVSDACFYFEKVHILGSHALIYRVSSLDVVTMIDLSKKIESQYEIIALSPDSIILLIILIFVGTYVKLTKHLGTLYYLLSFN